MSTTWKHIPDSAQFDIQRVPWLGSRKFFAVDASRSTGWNSALVGERDFVKAVPKHTQDQISLWGDSCDEPTKDWAAVDWESTRNGTQPSKILHNSAALKGIQDSDVWFLLTDGEVYEKGVHKLAELAQEKNVLNVPVVFVINGSRGRSPQATDISVGISFFASSQDTLIIFKETQTGKLYVVAAKGCFSPLSLSVTAKNDPSWSDLTSFKNEDQFFEQCKIMDLKVLKAEHRKDLPPGVSLGRKWEKIHGGPAYVDLDILPTVECLPDDELLALLEEEAFSTLAVAYKTRKRIPELRELVQRQKVRHIAPKLEDVASAGAILSRVGEKNISLEEKRQLQEQLREAHVKNREHYQSQIKELNTSPEALRIQRRNKTIDVALRHLSDIEAAGFTAEILARRSDRARRAAVVSADSSLSLANLNFNVPSYKAFCLVCCGEEEIMSISLKELDHASVDSNTTDFALDYPLAAGCSPANTDVISSQNICFQCALLGGGLSIYKEKLKAVIPALSYEGSNAKYINEQLYLALTAGLETGASGLSQLFMAILAQTTKTKSWAGASLEGTPSEQHEAVQRRDTFEWMVSNMVIHSTCRETFSEFGDWVAMPKALEWAAKDYNTQNLASFVVTYPVAGFMQLLSLGQKAGAFSENLLRAMKISKVLYSVTSLFLANLLKEPVGEKLWQQPFLAMLYREFNAGLIPKDLNGFLSLVTGREHFWHLLHGCLSTEKDLLADWTDEDKEIVIPRVQTIVFWLLYHQKYHISAQTFFAKMLNDYHVATAVLEPRLHLPEEEVQSILLSIFTSAKREIDADLADLHTGIAPFRTPFGPSVLHCAFDRCNASFVPANGDILADIEVLRKARTEHFVKAFGIQDRFEYSKTGLPGITSSPDPPSSKHSNVHASIVRAWVMLSPDERRKVVSDPIDRESFIASVLKKICQGRRGDIYCSTLQDEIRDTLPSFFQVLKEALKLQGENDSDIASFEHDFEKNKSLEGKVRYELRASARL